MIYENARKGIGKVFVGEVLQIIAAFCTILTLIPIMGPMIGGLASGVVGIIGVIIMLVGLGQSGKDSPQLKKAFIFVILTLIAGFIIGGLASFIRVSWIIQFEQIVSTVLMLIVTYNVLYGCAGLNPDLTDKANSTWKFYMIVVVLDIVLTVISIIFTIVGVAAGAFVVTIILVLLDLILDLIAYFKYLGFLKAAKDSL